jgi:uncharacterized Zn-finger protein
VLTNFNTPLISSIIIMQAQLDAIFESCRKAYCYEESDEEMELTYLDTDTEEEDNSKRFSKRSQKNDSTDLPYQCTYCDKSYKRTSERSRHVELFHEVEGRNEICVICGAHFVKKSQLRIHVASQHGKDPEAAGTTPEAIAAILNSRPYQCSYDNCTMTFPTEGKLKKHEKRHQDKRHICGFDDCNACFAFRKELQEHIKLAHTLKEFVCCLCDEEFSSLDTLQQHLRLHQERDKPMNNFAKDSAPETLQKVFRCEYDGCNRVYTNKKNLNQHVRANHLNVTFECDICEGKFKHKHSLKRHYTTAHKKTWKEPSVEVKEEKKSTKRKATKSTKTQQEYNEERPKRRKANDGSITFKLLGPRLGESLLD